MFDKLFARVEDLCSWNEGRKPKSPVKYCEEISQPKEVAAQYRRQNASCSYCISSLSYALKPCFYPPPVIFFIAHWVFPTQTCSDVLLRLCFSKFHARRWSTSCGNAMKRHSISCIFPFPCIPKDKNDITQSA